MAPKDERFQLIQKQYRKKFLLLQKQLEKEYGDISSKLMEKVRRVAFDYAWPDGTFLKSQSNQIKAEIEAINYWFSNEMRDWLDNNISESADIAIQGQDAAAEYHIRSLIQEAAGKNKALLRKAISDGESGILLRAKYGTGLADSIRTAVWKNRWDDGFRLSDRVWKMNQIMNENIKHMVEDCVNNGKSAVNFAKAVEDYLEVPGPAWRTDIRPGLQAGDTITTKTGISYTVKQPRATIKYNALRLARTETNQSYHRAQKMSDKESIVVKGTKWNLSSSHPDYGYYEICEKRADHDEGLGIGVYKAGETPFDHPNGLCWITSVLYEGEELVNELKQKYAS